MYTCKCILAPMLYIGKNKFINFKKSKEKSALNYHFFFLFTAAAVAYGSSWARGQIRAAASSLWYSHSSARSELPLWHSLLLVAMPDPWHTKWGQELNPHLHRDIRSLTHWATIELPIILLNLFFILSVTLTVISATIPTVGRESATYFPPLCPAENPKGRE